MEDTVEPLKACNHCGQRVLACACEIPCFCDDPTMVGWFEPVCIHCYLRREAEQAVQLAASIAVEESVIVKEGEVH